MKKSRADRTRENKCRKAGVSNKKLKKLIIFFPRKQTIAGGHVLFLGWARYLADQHLREVYFVYSNKPNMSMIKAYYSENVHYIDWEDTTVDRNALFVDADVFTPINYVMILMSYIPLNTNSRILTYIGNPLEKKWFENNLSYRRVRDKAALDACYQLFDATHSLSYMDLSCFVEVTGKICAHDFASYAPVFYQPAEWNYPLRDVIPNGRINIAWLGRLDTDKIESLLNMIENLYRCDIDQMPIDLHIIGDGNAKNRIIFSRFSPKIRFIFTSYLYGETLNTYLSQNADFAVAMGISALDIARVNVPVALPIVNHKAFKTNKYVYLFDTKDYTLGVTERFINMAGIRTFTLEDMLRQIYVEKCRKKLAARCNSYAREEFSIRASSLCLLRAMEQSTLTVQQLAGEKLINDELKGYERYKKFVPNNGIMEYIEFIHQENKAANKGQLDHLLFLPKKASRKVYRKVRGKVVSVVNSRKRAYKLRKEYNTVLRHYDNVLVSLKHRLREEGRIKVGFVVIFSSTFTYRPIFEAMQTSKEFDPYIIVVPDVSRSLEFRNTQFRQAMEELEEKYPGCVVAGYVPEANRHIDIGEQYGVLFFSNPYGKMVASVYQIRHFWKKNVLMLYAYYGFGATNYGRLVMQTDVYNSVWKLLLDTELSLKDLKIHQPIKGKNAVVTGYVKMDELARIPVEERKRKRILICPHHTVMNWDALNLSNFVPYAQGILELPKKYPDVDFVFRPHPMLFDNLRRYNIWTEGQIQDYLDQLEAIPNIVYSTEGDYMELFVNSDAMIHDCSSFIGEYLFTEHPCCYMYKPETKMEDVYTPLGLRCLEQYYPAHTWDDVIEFIDKVVIAENDPMAGQRHQFTMEVLKFAYPNSAQNVVNMIREAILSAKS